MGYKYKRETLIGQSFGDWKIISTCPNKFRNVIAECMGCNRSFSRQYYEIIIGKSKCCQKCSHLKNEIHKNLDGHRPSGNQSGHWKGTKDIPYDFFSQVKRSSIVRKNKFELSIEDLQEVWDKQGGKCAYTGLALKFRVNRAAKRVTPEQHLITPSVDRIDSNQSYNKNNIQFVCAPVNIMKNKYSESEFLKIIGFIAVKRFKL